MPLERRPWGGEEPRRVSRVSPDPGYTGILPRVFPYVWKGSREDAYMIIEQLTEIDRTGFALTESSKEISGRVSLWLSAAACEYLLDIYYIRKESVSRT